LSKERGGGLLEGERERGDILDSLGEERRPSRRHVLREVVRKRNWGGRDDDELDLNYGDWSIQEVWIFPDSRNRPLGRGERMKLLVRKNIKIGGKVALQKGLPP